MNNSIGVIALLAASALVSGCKSEGDDDSSEEPLLNHGDYVMVQCTVYFDDFMLDWSICKDNDLFSNRANQPVFTALDDCLLAKGIEQDYDPTVFDDSQEDRDRGWADMLYCAVVDSSL